jgi:hypothetical protein
MKRLLGTVGAAFAALALSGCATAPGKGPGPTVDVRTDGGTRTTVDGRGTVRVGNGEDGARVGPNGVEIVDRDKEGTNRVRLGKDGRLCVDAGQLFGGKVKLGNLCTGTAAPAAGTRPAGAPAKPAADSGIKF